MTMDWRRAKYVWVPTGTPGALQALGLEGQALLVYLARLCDARGVIRCDPGGSRQGLARLCGTHLHERRMFSAQVEALHGAGALRADPEGVRLAEFGEWQRTRDPRVRLYHREPPAFERLPTFTRALAAHLTRVCDDDGLVRCAGPQDWSDAATRAQYHRADLDRKMARRAACHLDTLLGFGFLARAEGGLLLPHHVAAQRKAETRAEGASAPPRSHDGPTTVPPRSHDGPTTVTRRSDVSVGNHTIDVGPPSLAVPSLPSDPPSVPPRPIVTAAEATPPARAQAPAPGPTEPDRQEVKQGSLFPGEPPPVVAAKGRRRARVAPPVLDLPVAEGSPGYEVYDYIVRHPMLSLLVHKPGEFVLSVMETYTRIDVAYEVKRAAEYLLGTSSEYSDGRAFLRRWLGRAQNDAKRAGAVDAVRLARGVQAAPAAPPALDAAAPARFVAATASGEAVPANPWGPSPRREAR